jgi:KaiC/GvpD/RAD55 family RecA-like ATPase/archaellum biogenesis ATPase FlaH
MNEIRIKTWVSQAHWCAKDGSFEPAKTTRGKTESINGDKPKIGVAKDIVVEDMCWLDRLFDGGLVLPEAEKGNSRALTVLLTGPAGTGKSTLALEICHRLALSKQDGLEMKEDGRLFSRKGKQLDGFNSLYISAETNGQWPMQKAKQLKWAPTDHIRLLMPDDPPDDKRHYVWIDTTKKFVDFLVGQPRSLLGGVPKAALKEALKQIVPAPEITDEMIEKWKQDLDAKANERSLMATTDIITRFKLDVLVVDSLNSIGTSKAKSGIMEHFVSLIDGTRLKVIIAILESGDPTLDQWLYVFDTVIRLDMVNIGKKDAEGYLMRTLEIKKARYQSHVWGAHQLKFSKPAEDPSERPAEEKTTEKAVRTLSALSEARRAHPYCKEGGVFIFPSIPYHLSLYKRLSPEWTDEKLSTGIPELDLDLRGEPEEQGGFPYQRCTGFIGMRGGHKSHLGYRFVLNHILGKPKHKALVVSLRDDENMARGTMAKILTEVPAWQEERRIPVKEMENAERAAEDDLRALELKDQLELQFFPPGHIAPEEFYHKILISVLRLKEGEGDVVLLFNSLDQLASRFPLCAKEETFVPGLIETLTANRVTSVFIGVDEEGQPSQQYGLLSMADALISFNRVRIGREDYLGHIEEAIAARKMAAWDSAKGEQARRKAKKVAGDEARKLIEALKNKAEPFENLYPRPVVLDIVRFAGGQAAKIGGMLELKHLGEGENRPIWGREHGLCYVPFSKKYRRRAPSEVISRHDLE